MHSDNIKCLNNKLTFTLTNVTIKYISTIWPPPLQGFKIEIAPLWIIKRRTKLVLGGVEGSIKCNKTIVKGSKTVYCNYI